MWSSIKFTPCSILVIMSSLIWSFHSSTFLNQDQCQSSFWVIRYDHSWWLWQSDVKFLNPLQHIVIWFYCRVQFSSSCIILSNHCEQSQIWSLLIKSRLLFASPYLHCAVFIDMFINNLVTPQYFCHHFLSSQYKHTICIKHWCILHSITISQSHQWSDGLLGHWWFAMV
jgi:hypothetical protein